MSKRDAERDRERDRERGTERDREKRERNLQRENETKEQIGERKDRAKNAHDLDALYALALPWTLCPETYVRISLERARRGICRPTKKQLEMVKTIMAIMMMTMITWRQRSMPLKRVERDTLMRVFCIGAQWPLSVSASRSGLSLPLPALLLLLPLRVAPPLPPPLLLYGASLPRLLKPAAGALAAVTIPPLMLLVVAGASMPRQLAVAGLVLRDPRRLAPPLRLLAIFHPQPSIAACPMHLHVPPLHMICHGKNAGGTLASSVSVASLAAHARWAAAAQQMELAPPPQNSRRPLLGSPVGAPFQRTTKTTRRNCTRSWPPVIALSARSMSESGTRP
jgi:hypothetical protein